MIHTTNTASHKYILFGLLASIVFSGLLFTHSADAQLVPLANNASCVDVCRSNDYIYNNNNTPDDVSDDSCLCAGKVDYVLASTASNLGTLGTIVTILIGIVVSLAFLFFFWNLATYIRDEKEHEEAKKRMGWSVLAIVVITSLWGLVAFVRNFLGIGPGQANNLTLPTVIGGNSRSTDFFEYTDDTGSTGGGTTGGGVAHGDYQLYTIPSARCEQTSDGQEITRCANSKQCHTDPTGCRHCHNNALAPPRCAR